MASMLNTLFNVGFKRKTTETTSAEISAASTSRVDQAHMERPGRHVERRARFVALGTWDKVGTPVFRPAGTPPRAPCFGRDGRRGLLVGELVVSAVSRSCVRGL